MKNIVSFYSYAWFVFLKRYFIVGPRSIGLSKPNPIPLGYMPYGSQEENPLWGMRGDGAQAKKSHWET